MKQELQSQPQKPTDHTFWIGIFIGGLLGAILIVVLGTDRGKKIAKRLTEEGLDWLDDKAVRVDEKVSEFEEKSEALIEKGKELIEQGKEMQEQVVMKAEEIKDETVDTAIAKADEALAHIEALQERGRQTTQELRKKLFKNIPKKTSA